MSGFSQCAGRRIKPRAVVEPGLEETLRDRFGAPGDSGELLVPPERSIFPQPLFDTCAQAAT
jgi:hypothetical protein